MLESFGLLFGVTFYNRHLMEERQKCLLPPLSWILDALVTDVHPEDNLERNMQSKFFEENNSRCEVPVHMRLASVRGRSFVIVI